MALFEHQVAGHNDILALPDGRLAKPASATELSFYLEAQKPEHAKLKSFMPAFFGEINVQNDGQDTATDRQSHIAMENLLSKFRAPCLLDVKLGTVLYDINASPAKVAKMVEQAASTTSGKTGLRICGMKIYDQQTGGYVAAPRDFFRKLSEQDLPGALRTFFCRPDGTFAFRDAIPIVLERLHGIKAAFSSEKVSLIASSVLVAYEALDTDPTSDKAPDRPHVEVRIIDFAHSRFLEGDDVVDDEGYVFGLDNLIGMLDAAYRKEGEEVCD